MIELRLSLRLRSSLNQREHWGARARRAKQERKLAYWTLKANRQARPPFPLLVTITRIAPRQLDSDNLAGAAKGVRDGLADALGVDDGDEGDEGRVTWAYAQRKGEPREYAVEVTIEERRS